METKGEKDVKKTAQPAVKPDKKGIISKVLEDARDRPEFDNFTDDQKDIAIGMVEKMFSRFPTLDFPTLNEDGTIEMDLMHGGHIHIAQPKGGHYMTAMADMETANEKGNKEDMLPIYMLAACANIDGEPVSIFSLKEDLSARDFTNLLKYFRSANLL